MSEEKDCVKYSEEHALLLEQENIALRRTDYLHETIWQKEKIASLESRLKEAMEENSRLRSGCGDDVSQCAFFVQLQMNVEKIQSLEARLSHLMDVAGKMANELSFFVEEKHLERHQCVDSCRLCGAESLIAEWDGIKKEGK